MPGKRLDGVLGAPDKLLNQICVGAARLTFRICDGTPKLVLVPGNRDTALATLRGGLHHDRVREIKLVDIRKVGDAPPARLAQPLDSLHKPSVARLVSNAVCNLHRITWEAKGLGNLGAGRNRKLGSSNNATHTNLATNASNLVNIHHGHVMKHVAYVRRHSSLAPREHMRLNAHLASALRIDASHPTSANNGELLIRYHCPRPRSMPAK